MAPRRSSGSSASQSEAAARVLEKIRNLSKDVPGFAQPKSKKVARSLVASASLSDSFLETVAVAIQSSPDLASASRVDPNEVRDAIRFAAAYGAVADELEAFARGVRHTINIKRSAAVQGSLAAYDLAKGLARSSDGAALVPHIAEIRKTIKRGAPRRKSVSKTPQP